MRRTGFTGYVYDIGVDYYTPSDIKDMKKNNLI